MLYLVIPFYGIGDNKIRDMSRPSPATALVQRERLLIAEMYGSTEATERT